MNKDYWGIGKEFIFYSVLISIIVFILNLLYFKNLTFPNSILLKVLSLILIFAGFFIYFLSLKTIKPCLIKNQLCTKGIYSYIQHPLYFSWIFLIVPGFILLTKYIFGLLVPFLMYIIFKILIPREELELREKFGKAYLRYKEGVWV